MIDIKRNVIFSLENRKKNGVSVVENVPIRMRVIFMGNRVDFSTGFRIDTSKWDENKQRVKNGCTNKLKQSSSDINTKLQEYENNIQNIFKIFETQDINPTTELLKTEFKNLFKDDNEKEKSSKKGFLKVFDEFTKESGRQNDWTYSTFEKFASVKNHLIKFSTKLSFDLFDEKGLNDYVIFLRDVEQMRNSTIGKQIGFLKWFLRWSKQKGYNKNLAFETFKPKLKSTPKKVIFLHLKN